MRRNTASPSTRQGPLRATQQFALVSGSPSRKLVVRQALAPSPTAKVNKATTTRSHSETGFVSDRRSPTLANYKVEKPKALRAGGSLDNISLYLSGQWPKDTKQKLQESLPTNYAPTVAVSTSNSHHSYSGSSSPSYYTDGVFRKDAHTQTPEEWEDVESRKPSSHSKFVLYKRSKSVGSADNWSLKSRDIKAKLQRKDNSSRSSQPVQRFSPVLTITTTLSPHSTQPIKIPVPARENGVMRGTPGKARASVEGLNPEIEKLIISAVSAATANSEDSSLSVPGYYFEHPDGHRAPIPELLNNARSVDTQTPNQSELHVGGETFQDYICNGERTSSRASTDTDDGSRPQSISPSPLLLGPLDIDEAAIDSADYGRHNSSAAAVSPRPNSAQFVRLPPDGAEKLKIVNETAAVPPMKTLLTPSLISTVNIQPSERSAFSSLDKRSKATTMVGGGIIPCRSPKRFVEEMC